MQIQKRHIETALIAIVCSFGCWAILLAVSRVSVLLNLSAPVQLALILVVWPFASYKLLMLAPDIISRLFNNKRAAKGGEPPNRFDYRRELSEEITARGGKCRGFMRLVILERGAWADGDYDKADLIYGIARVMLDSPHFAVEMQTAMLCYQMMLGGHGQKDILQTIISSAAANCPCEHCKAERAVKEREATNN